MKKVSLGIIGTAKNTGKTTTAIALVNFLVDTGISLGLTSIGYDGERVDNVTGLPKPRFFAPRGLLVATAERCLPASSARLTVLHELNVETPLGRVLLCRVSREGLVVLAGPNQKRHLRAVIERLYREGAGLTIIDGALNRMAPLAEADGVILATGAAYCREVERVARHAHYLSVICNFPPKAHLPAGASFTAETVAWDDEGRVVARAGPSLTEPEQLQQFFACAGKVKFFLCPGLILSPCLSAMLEAFPSGVNYIFADPVKLMLCGDAELAHNFIETVAARGGSVGYLRPLPLLAVTVNPFYPQYRADTNEYQPAYVNREELLEKVAALAKVPVFDVVYQGAETLGQVVLDFVRAEHTGV